MASPQPTPFVRFSKELLEAFYQNPPETVAGCRLWLWVLRHTWGNFGRDETPAQTIGAVAAAVGVGKTTACRTLLSLVRCRRLQIGKNGGYAVQKDYDLWRPDPAPRADHYASRAQQGALFTPVDNLLITPPIVAHVGTTPFPRGEQNRSLVGQSAVPSLGTPIWRKTTVENREKGPGNGAGPAPKGLPNGKNDTPTNRAALGDWEYAPQDHHAFARLSFKLQDALAEQWREAAETKRRAAACRSGCGRPKAAEGWPYCRPCTVCASCGGVLDGVRKFQAVGGVITCTACTKAAAEKF